MECIFCKIINGDIPSSKVYEDDILLAFRDINPQAPVHIIIIPKSHIATLDDINAGNSHIIASIYEKIPVIADMLKLDNGYRVVANCGKDAGQTIFHLHFHLLGGKTLLWEN